MNKNLLILILIILGTSITEIIVRVIYYNVFKKDDIIDTKDYDDDDDDMEDNMGAMG